MAIRMILGDSYQVLLVGIYFHLLYNFLLSQVGLDAILMRSHVERIEVLLSTMGCSVIRV